MKRRRALQAIGVFLCAISIIFLWIMNANASYFTEKWQVLVGKSLFNVPQSVEKVSASLLQYRDNSYGISFEYPSDWQSITSISATGSPLEQVVTGFGPKGRKLSLSPLIQLIFWQNPKNLSIDAYQQQVGKQMLTSCGQFQCNRIVFVPVKNGFLEIQGIATPDVQIYQDSQQKVLQEIYSTLKLQ